MKINIGNDLYLKGRIGWKGLSKDEYLEESNFRIINGYSLKDGYIDWNIAGYISEDRYEESPEIKLEINDILISKDGTIGKVGIVRNLVSPTTVASGIFVLRNIIKDKLDTEYLFQFLKSSNFKAFINAVKASGSTIIHLYQRDLAKLELEVPHISVQKAISRVLFTIDSKIELNNRINAELEAMAKTIYDYWFVQFDFPDKNGKPYKSSGGKMVWNEELKREVPEGWEVKRICDKITIGSGFPFDSDVYKEVGDFKIITIKNVQDGYLDTSTVDYVSTIPPKIAKHCILREGDILISLTGNVGRMCFVDQNNLLLNQRVGKIIGEKEFVLYSYFFFKRPENQERLSKLANGSSQANLSPIEAVKDYFSVPPQEIMNSFSRITQPLISRILLNNQENQKLASLRDWLLPMLMNGQVKVM